MLIDDILLDAVADAYLSIQEQHGPLSMTFSDALNLCCMRNGKYVLQIELIKKADHYYEKSRIKNGYAYYPIHRDIRPAVHCFG